MFRHCSASARRGNPVNLTVLTGLLRCARNDVINKTLIRLSACTQNTEFYPRFIQPFSPSTFQPFNYIL
ncbi:MAG: hypothetical protein LBK53_07365 [Heliobacteriaceae bacterium]|nr:hypothetical protein [Heliobacteriaceae bacterium]